MPRMSLLVVLTVAIVASCGSSTESTATTASVPAQDRPTTSPGDPTPPGTPPAVAPAPSPSGGDTCQADSDCVLSTSPGCCSCCQCAPLHALTAAAERARAQRCTVIECARPNCAAEQCVPCGSTSASARAVCRDGACVVAP